MGQWLIADLSVSDVQVPALDAVSHRHCIALVCLRLGDAVAFAESLKPVLAHRSSPCRLRLFSCRHDSGCLLGRLVFACNTG